ATRSATESSGKPSAGRPGGRSRTGSRRRSAGTAITRPGGAGSRAGTTLWSGGRSPRRRADLNGSDSDRGTMIMRARGKDAVLSIALAASLFAAVLAAPPAAEATVFHVRPDGNDDFCNGLVNAADPGTPPGVLRACAFR